MSQDAVVPHCTLSQNMQYSQLQLLWRFCSCLFLQLTACTFSPLTHAPLSPSQHDVIEVHQAAVAALSSLLGDETTCMVLHLPTSEQN